MLTCEAMEAKLFLSEERRRIAKKHPLLMARIYFPEWCKNETPDFHWDLCNAYMHQERSAWAAPVGSGKTTVLTKICTIWSIFFEEDQYGQVDDVLIIGGAADLASIFLNDMGNKLKQSEELREDFGEFVGSMWGSQSLEFCFKRSDGFVYRTAYIRVTGRLGTNRGRRPRRIHVDDPQDAESVKSEKQREDYEQWFWGELVNRMDPGNKLSYIGNAISEETFIVQLVKAPPPGWYVRTLPMLNETTDPPTSLWPSRWPVEYLLKRKAEIGEAAFRTEFQCDPVRMWHQRIFDVTRVRFAPWVIQDDDFVSLTVDPSYVSGRDPWAITMVSVDRHGDWHEIESPQESTGLEGWLDELLRIRLEYPKINVCGVEGGGGAQQGGMDYILRKWMLEHGVSLPIQILKHSHTQGPKESRISKLTGVINGGRLTLQPGHLKIYHVLRDYRSGIVKQDDHLPDSLSMHLEVQMARTPYDPPAKTWEEQRHENYMRVKARIAAANLRTGAAERWLDRYAVKG